MGAEISRDISRHYEKDWDLFCCRCGELVFYDDRFSPGFEGFNDVSR